jgi:RNA polymerase sigma-70 factor (ECF subfamily)
MDAETDAALVCAGRAGERRALDTLVGRYQRPVFNAALRILGSRDDASEVTQTVFMKAFEKLDRYDPEQRFFSWIYRIAVNESLDCLAARRRHDPMSEDLVVDRPEPDAQCEQDQLEHGLQAALLVLTPEQRTIIVLKHLLGCSYENLCTILDVPLTTVKSRLFAARGALREVCAKRGLL